MAIDYFKSNSPRFLPLPLVVFGVCKHEWIDSVSDVGFCFLYFYVYRSYATIFSKNLEKNDFATPAEVKQKVVVPEDSMLRRHFLTHLRTEVEAEIMLHPIDPNLRHYYEASVAAEIQKRLAG